MPSVTAPFAYALKNGTVSNTALSLGTAPFDFSAANIAAADHMKVTANANSVSYTIDATVPTAAVGHVLAASTNVTITGQRNIATWQMIRVGSDATVTVTLLKYS